KQSFLGYMIYNRLWFHKDLYALTLGGGAINNPGRYLVLLPINGATAFSGTPLLYREPRRSLQSLGCFGNSRLHAQPIHHLSLGIQPSCSECSVFLRPGHHNAFGGNDGPPGSFVPDFTPDLRKRESRLNFAMLVKF
ncbi:MAG TPA: porin, partial [Candidatus Sulfotelmatobacter sp.]|nr:porin [Candidatus Sulfotelmatobacter sp.]